MKVLTCWRAFSVAVALSVVALAADAADLVIAGRGDIYGQGLAQAVAGYRKLHPDTDIELLKLPNNNLYQKLKLSMRERTGAYDLVMMDDTWTPEFIANGWLKPLSEALADADMVQSTVALGRAPSGGLYALPIVGNVEMFAYRKDLLASRGLQPPHSWDDVLKIARTTGADKGVSGVVFRGTKGNPVVTGYLPILWAYGGDVVDAGGKVTIDSPQALAALRMLIALKAAAPKDVDVYGAAEVRDALQRGVAAQAIEVWPAWIPALDDPSKSRVVGQIALQSPPGQVKGPAPMLGIWQMGIPNDAPHANRAADFLAYLTSPATQAQLATLGIPPTRKSVFANPALVRQYRWYPDQLKALEAGRARPRVKGWQQIEAILGDSLQLALTGQVAPDVALRQAAQKIALVLPVSG
ncbi:MULTISPECIES: ABC transporter substrate-binding protein [unclassified Paraburkholderia]|uniref:ABC transporter substrate-binding protein n=1 Tax=unclassified Paraburkholderia TaxID=2615204 RepID=UPI0016074AF3|nr:MULTISPECIES: ABC transporter substrate-binding protein [unclassified Paraburkholderia]MBB5445511.1 multiple sugar transport system substrate-binding protein [Paraburkholderia sp. WSM4177]MBB5486009.1 multiple sugar transport system substrate-binding protein [Paraburkholderia sp. WSM4180]